MERKNYAHPEYEKFDEIVGSGFHHPSVIKLPIEPYYKKDSNYKYILSQKTHIRIESLIDDAEFEPLQHMPSIEVIFVNLKPGQVRYFKRFKNLRFASIFSFSNLDLYDLPQNNLEKLELYVNEIESEKLIIFNKLKYLGLFVSDFNSLYFLKDLPDLKELFINPLPCSLSGIHHAAGLKKLSLLHCNGKRRISNFSPLQELKNLRELALYKTEMSKKDYRLLKKSNPSLNIVDWEPSFWDFS